MFRSLLYLALAIILGTLLIVVIEWVTMP